MVKKITDKIVNYCEEKGIATRETLKIFFAVCVIYIFSIAALQVRDYALEWAFSLMALGGLANLYVISFNGHKMPVPVAARTVGAMRKKFPKRGVCQLTKNTKLAWLSDKYLIRYWKEKVFYASIGDFAVTFGVVLMFTRPLMHH